MVINDEQIYLDTYLVSNTEVRLLLLRLCV